MPVKTINKVFLLKFKEALQRINIKNVFTFIYTLQT